MILITQGSIGPRVDSVYVIQKHGFQHHEGEDNVGSVQGIVEYVLKPSTINKLYLMCRLFNLQMSEGHTNEFNMIVSQLTSVKINFEDEAKSLIVMTFLPKSWDTIVVVINSSKDLKN